MRYIEKMTSIPVPHIYHWGTAAENPLGLGAFIIMDYIPHTQSLADILADPTVEDLNEQGLDPSFPRDKLERMYRQVANIVLQLSKLSMPKIGSLNQDGDSSWTVSNRPLTQVMNDLIVQGGIPPSILPPEHTTYSTSAEYYTALADLHMAHLTLQHNDAIQSANDCRDKFIARHLFRQQVRQGKLLTPSPNSYTNSHSNPNPNSNPNRNPNSKEKETFKLYIDDFHPHNILLDTNLNIVGVIDWEWAYFAPAAFTHDPPWWLLLLQPEAWRGGVLDFRDEFEGVVELFCKILREVEEEEEDEKEREEERVACGKGQEPRFDLGVVGDGSDEGEWDIDQHIGSLSLDVNKQDLIRLSDRMRQNWASGAFWVDYAARGCYGFEPVFWEFLDKRWFGKNVDGGYEGRMHLLSEKVKGRMELFVERKRDESDNYRIVDWDPEEARAYLAEILADLDSRQHADLNSESRPTPAPDL